MRLLKRIFRHRKIRRLAEQCLVAQTVFSSETLICGNIEAAIKTAELFYSEWDKRKK